MSFRLLYSVLAVAALGSAAQAKGPVPVKVDAKGGIQIPLATLKQLGVTPDRTGSILIQFPLPAALIPKVRPPLSPNTLPVMQPSRILVPVDKGRALFPRTKIGPGVYVPGKPGTKYLASGSGHMVILRNP